MDAIIYQATYIVQSLSTTNATKIVSFYYNKYALLCT